MRISDWSSDVCSSDLRRQRGVDARRVGVARWLQPVFRPLQLVAIHRARQALEEGVADAGDDDEAVAGAVAGVGNDDEIDRKSGVEGRRVDVRVDLGGRSRIKKKRYRKKKI